MSSRLAAILLWLGGSVLGLTRVELQVPEGVILGSSATFICQWMLEADETLYTVKWYHNSQEFFRYVPKEMPDTRVFSQTGFSVDLSESGGRQVVLRGVTHELSGKYRCEVSADAPFFHTVYKTAAMRVVEPPEYPPRVRAEKSWYSVGDMLRTNCTSPPGDPAANLTWLINGREVKGLDIPQQATPYKSKSVIPDASLEDAKRIIFSPWNEEPARERIADFQMPNNIGWGRDSSGNNKTQRNTSLVSRREQIADKLNISTEVKPNKSPSFSQLVTRVQSIHFNKGHLNVTCVARVYSVWAASGVLLIDEERPQIAPVMGSRDSNSGLCKGNGCNDQESDDDDGLEGAFFIKKGDGDESEGFIGEHFTTDSSSEEYSTERRDNNWAWGQQERTVPAEAPIFIN